MKIGFDAKRLFCNFTGLGNYSRTLVQNFTSEFPENAYYLFTPKIIRSPRTRPFLERSKYKIIQPRIFRTLWRSNLMLKDLHKEQIDVYHGLSHEIPFGIHRLSFRKIVTIHDLIFKYYPQDYRKSDRLIYDSKVRYACKHADGIIAISQSTKNDIMKYYGTEEQKISVIYQTCDRVFSENAEFDLVNVRNKYSLPESYLLYVGSVISRKNLGNIIKAMSMLKTNLQVPLVILGSGNSYYKEVRSIISEYKLEHLVIHLSNVDFNDFPAIYRASKMLIYPSYYEGFGIPVLEAISSGTPVITSNQSSLTEAGGDVAHYVDPANIDEIADGIQILLEDEDYRALLLSRASRHLDKFKPRVLSEQLMDVYLQNG